MIENTRRALGQSKDRMSRHGYIKVPTVVQYLNGIASMLLILSKGVLEHKTDSDTKLETLTKQVSEALEACTNKATPTDILECSKEFKTDAVQFKTLQDELNQTFVAMLNEKMGAIEAIQNNYKNALLTTKNEIIDHINQLNTQRNKQSDDYMIEIKEALKGFKALLNSDLQQQRSGVIKDLREKETELNAVINKLDGIAERFQSIANKLETIEPSIQLAVEDLKKIEPSIQSSVNKLKEIELSSANKLKQIEPSIDLLTNKLKEIESAAIKLQEIGPSINSAQEKMLKTVGIFEQQSKDANEQANKAYESRIKLQQMKRILTEETEKKLKELAEQIETGMQESKNQLVDAQKSFSTEAKQIQEQLSTKVDLGNNQTNEGIQTVNNLLQQANNQQSAIIESQTKLAQRQEEIQANYNNVVQAINTADNNIQNNERNLTKAFMDRYDAVENVYRAIQWQQNNIDTQIKILAGTPVSEEQQYIVQNVDNLLNQAKNLNEQIQNTHTQTKENTEKQADIYLQLQQFFTDIKKYVDKNYQQYEASTKQILANAELNNQTILFNAKLQNDNNHDKMVEKYNRLLTDLQSSVSQQTKSLEQMSKSIQEIDQKKIDAQEWGLDQNTKQSLDENMQTIKDVANTIVTFNAGLTKRETRLQSLITKLENAVGSNSQIPNASRSDMFQTSTKSLTVQKEQEEARQNISTMNAQENAVRNQLNQAKKQLEDLLQQKQRTMADVERLAVVKKVLESDTNKRDQKTSFKRPYTQLDEERGFITIKKSKTESQPYVQNVNQNNPPQANSFTPKSYDEDMQYDEKKRKGIEDNESVQINKLVNRVHQLRNDRLQHQSVDSEGTGPRDTNLAKDVVLYDEELSRDLSVIVNKASGDKIPWETIAGVTVGVLSLVVAAIVVRKIQRSRSSSCSSTE